MNDVTDSSNQSPTDPPMPTWMLEALRAPVSSTIDARERIVAAVRTEATQVPHGRACAVRSVRDPRMLSRWRQRALSPFSGVLTSLMLALFVLLRVGNSVTSADAIAFTRVLGDSIVPVSSVSGSESPDSRWLDTLRVVEFVLRAPSVHRAVAIGAFNQWQRDASPLHRVGRDEWRARVLVPRDALQLGTTVAVLIDNVRAVPTIAR